LASPKKEIQDLIRYIGLYGNIRAIFILITENKVKIPDSVFKGCKKAILKRNKIVHRAETTVTYNEAKEAIWNIKKIIEFIINLTKEV
jgi:hypothetical protein